MGDAIAVPSELTTKAGSDFDVDKLTTYLNNYLLNESGLPERIPAFDNIQDARDWFSKEFTDEIETKLNRILDYDEFRDDLLQVFSVIESLAGQGIFSIENLEKGLSPKLFDFYQYYATTVINQIMDQANEKGVNPSTYLTDQIEALKEKKISLKEKLKDEVLRKNYVKKRIKMSIQNEYIRTMAQIVLHPSNFKKLVSPTTAEEFESKAPQKGKPESYTRRINKLKNPNWEDTTKVYNPALFTSFLYMTRSRNAYLQSKTGVGVYAVSTTSHSNFQKFLSVIEPHPKDGDVVFYEPLTLVQPMDFIKFKHNQVTIKGIKYASFSGVGKNYNVSEYLSKMITGAVDNVKDNWIEAYGATGLVRGIAALGIKLEIDPYELGLMMNHPIVKEYIRLNAARKSPSYQVDEILRDANSSYDDQDIYENFRKALQVQRYTYEIPEFGEAERIKFERHIRVAGENHDFKKFLSTVTQVQDRELSLAVLRNFLQLKAHAEDLRVVVDTSNHETMNLNSNYASKVKDANKAGTDENGNPAKYLNQERVVKLGEKMEELAFNAMMHSGRTPQTYSLDYDLLKDNIEDIFSVDSPIYEKLVDDIEALKSQSTIDKVKDGSALFDDCLSLEEVDGSPYWYIKIKGKPQADEFAQNQFYEWIKNLKAHHPDIYQVLTAATLLQSGTFFDRNAFTSYILPEDYAEFSKAITAFNVDDLFFENLEDNYVANFFRKGDNEKSTRIDKIYPPKIIEFYHTEEGIQATDIRPLNATILANNVKPKKFTEGRDWEPTINDNGELNKIYIFPVLRGGFIPISGTTPVQFEKDQIIPNKYVQRRYLHWTVKGEENQITEYIIKNTGLLITVGESEYTVFQHIPVRGTPRHLEMQMPNEDPQSRNSEFLSNIPVDYLSQDEVKALLEDKFSDFTIPHKITKAKPQKLKVDRIVSKEKPKSTTKTTKNVEIFKGFWTRDQVKKQQDKVFLFGDNTDDRLNSLYIPSSTQAVIRGLPNAIGIDTKKDRGTEDSSYFTDEDFDTFKQQTDEAIQQAKASGKIIVLPADGIGTGKAILKDKAPKLFNYLQQELNKLKEEPSNTTQENRVTLKAGGKITLEEFNTYVLNYSNKVGLNNFTNIQTPYLSEAMVFKAAIAKVLDNINNLEYQSFERFITKESLQKLKKIQPLVVEARKINLLVSGNDTRNSENVYKYVELYNKIKETFVEVINENGDKFTPTLKLSLEKPINKVLDKFGYNPSLNKNQRNEITTRLKDVSPPRWLEKEQVKSKVATQYIGEGASNSSTDKYDKLYREYKASNTGVYTQSDIVWVSSNGTRDNRINPIINGVLQGVYTNIDAAVKAGASIIMDTEEHVKETNTKGRKFQNIGELALEEYMKTLDYTRDEKGLWIPNTSLKPKGKPAVDPSCKG
jgi:hypothetical protein